MKTHPVLSSPDAFGGDFFLQVSMGLVEGYSGETKYGINPAVGSTEEDIWEGGGLYNWLETPEQLSVVSASVNDVGHSGTGAHVVLVEGLDENWLYQSEYVTLNGLTPVLTTGTYIRCWRAGVINAETRLGQDGVISITGAVSGLLVAVINPEANQTLQAIFTCPADKVAVVTAANVSTGNASASLPIRVLFYSKGNFLIDEEHDHDEPKRLRRSTYLFRQSTYGTFRPMYVMPPKTDMWISAVGNASASPVSAEWHMLLIDTTRAPAFADYVL